MGGRRAGWAAAPKRQPHSHSTALTEGLRAQFGGGGPGQRGDEDAPIQVGSLLTTGLFVYLLFSGKIFVVFDIIFKSWLLFFALCVALIGGVKLWTDANVVEGACPTCSSPVSAVKNKEGQSCLFCGQLVTAEKSERSGEWEVVRAGPRPGSPASSSRDRRGGMGMGMGMGGMMGGQPRRSASADEDIIDVDIMDN